MKAKVLVDRDFFRKYYLLLRNVMIIGEAHTHLTPSHCPPVLHDFQNIHALTSAVETCAIVQRVASKNILIKSNEMVPESARYFSYHLGTSLKSFKMQRVRIVKIMMVWNSIGNLFIEDVREVSGYL